jgi:hypothetical protein
MLSEWREEGKTESKCDRRNEERSNEGKKA